MIKKTIFKAFNVLGYNIVHTNKKGKVTQHQVLGIMVDANKHDFLVKGKDMLQQLANKKGAVLNIDSNDVVTIKFQAFHFFINTWEEILILHEVFIEGMYNYNTSKDYLLIDVGMNVGITSIFHSNNSNCKEIVSFEPFAATIELAKKNFAMNSSSSKITPVNTGLGYPARTLQINYSAEYKGSVGINGIADYVKEENDITDTAVLEIDDVDEQLRPILTENRQLQKVMKIDAEGVEYEIIERLAATGLLREIDFLMIEWHVKGPNALTEILLKQGFYLMSFNSLDKSIGMVYAFNGNGLLA